MDGRDESANTISCPQGPALPYKDKVNARTKTLAILRSEAASKVSQRTLTFAERIAYQRAIDEVYWRHRIWPNDNPDPKPSLDTVLPQAQLEKRVVDYLRDSEALEDYWQRPITAGDLQAEMDRMAKNTKQPEVLRELFDALGNDPLVVAECLARPVLAAHLMVSLDAIRIEAGVSRPNVIAAASANYMLPKISEGSGGCIDDTWTATSISSAPDARFFHTAVWTGSEMIVWGGQSSCCELNTGGRYNPSTDSWTATSITNAPGARFEHTVVLTSSEMIVWGGLGVNSIYSNTGGRYNLSTTVGQPLASLTYPMADGFIRQCGPAAK